MVTQSAQKMCSTQVGHLVVLPSQALTRDSQIVWCYHSTMPFVQELYREMWILWILYLSTSQLRVATQGMPLLVTTSLMVPHLHNMSSKRNVPNM
jgi:hypothetical protein